MKVSRTEPFPEGYTAVTEIGRLHPEMLLDFGILNIPAGGEYSSESEDRERAFLLLKGNVVFHYDSKAVSAARASVLDDGPWTLHVSAGVPVSIRASQDSEIVVEQVVNPDPFPGHVYSPEEIRSERFGEGTMQETSTRLVRTIFDAATHEKSRMVLGEVINHPGKWSSYPPHAHAHPEVYHYRFFPDQGFGFSQCGDSVFRVTNRDTVTIPGGVDHPQVAAPGYAMFYVWMIPHLNDNRFGPDSREFNPAHTWVSEQNAPIWDSGDQER